MQTLETMRRRIESAQDLHAVVRVMKALAAVSIRQYEKSVVSLSEYNRTIELGLQVLLRNRPEDIATSEPQFNERWAGIVFGSDQGMCGSFNDQVTSLALRKMSQLPGRPNERTVLAVGLRVVGRLEDAGCQIGQCFPVPGSVAGIAPVVHDLLLKVEELRVERGLSRFILFHHRPISDAASRPHEIPLLPVNPSWLRDISQRLWPSRSLPAFTMDWRRLFSALIRQHLFVVLYRAVAESLASENASRLASMQAAEKNIQEHLAGLTMRYHQERQQSITEELLDIVTGFETLIGAAGREP
ncbi:MAG: F0F1 ATP synthase subunit gamma [Planctomycetes bacterium]|nr:F0F1 ATP synthase subunit gamma [Planctomycetota bacterium]